MAGGRTAGRPDGHSGEVEEDEEDYADEVPPDVKDELEGRSLYVLARSNPLRVFLARVSHFGVSMQ